MRDLNIVNNLNINYDNLNIHNYLKEFKLDVRFTTILNTSSDVTICDIGHSNPSNYYNNSADIIYLYNTEYSNNLQLETYSNAKELIYHGTNISEEIKKYVTVLIPATSFSKLLAVLVVVLVLVKIAIKLLLKLIIIIVWRIYYYIHAILKNMEQFLLLVVCNIILFNSI